MSKKRSPGDGSGRSAKPRSGVGLEQPVDLLAGLARVELERGLVAEACEGALGLRPGGELGEGRDPGRAELLELRAAQAGDLREVVGLLPLPSQRGRKSQRSQKETG